MEKITKIHPAWDKRDPDPKKDYGIHCVQIFMVLKGEKGAIHFTFSTGIFLDKTEERLAATGALDWKELSPGHWFSINKAMGYDVGYHARDPQFEGHEVMWPTKMRKTGPKPLDVAFDKVGDAPPICEWLGVPCYCDGSAMRAEEWFKVLKAEGSDKIWAMMEEDYKERFGELI